MSGSVQFSAVIEVEWVGLNGNKKRFAFDLQQSGLPSGSQDKKFSANVGIGTPIEDVAQPSTNLPDPTSSASTASASAIIFAIVIITAMF